MFKAHIREVSRSGFPQRDCTIEIISQITITVQPPFLNEMMQSYPKDPHPETTLSTRTALVARKVNGTMVLTVEAQHAIGDTVPRISHAEAFFATQLPKPIRDAILNEPSELSMYLSQSLSPMEMLSELHRIIRPGGILICSESCGQLQYASHLKANASLAVQRSSRK